MSIQAIKVLTGCGASGKSLAADTVYTVPGEVSEADAALLVRMGRAELAEIPAKPAKPTRRKPEAVQ